MTYDLFMPRILLSLIFAALAFPCCAQTAGSGAPAGPAPTANFLSFEGAPAGQVPTGWSGAPSGTVVVDDTVVHQGLRCVRLERDRKSERDSSVLFKKLPMEFSGKKLELRGFLRMEKVSYFAGLLMREDKNGAPVELENMQARELSGTSDWKEYSITLRINPTADHLVFGAMLAGTGRVWVSDLRLYVDGKLYSPAPKAAALGTPRGGQVEAFAAGGVTAGQ
jgi:hypothetical protein